MNRLRTPPSLGQAAGNFVLGLLAVGIFFGVLYLAALNDSRAAIQDALDARAQAETKLQRAARGVCNDHPQRAGRTLEPVWTSAGQMECHVVLAQQEGGAQ